MNNSRDASNDIVLNFTITKPEFGWLISARTRTKEFKSILLYVNIMLDGRGHRFVETNSYLSAPFNYSEKITNLTEGTHNLEIKAKCQGWDLEIHELWERKLLYETSSGNVSFTIDTMPPNISILNPTNNSVLDASDISNTSYPLTFKINETVSWVGYSFDGKETTTINGNTALSELSNGLHSVIVYAKDEFENMGVSEIVIFSVAEPESEPFPTTFAVAASVVSASLIAVGVLVYFKKRERKSTININ
jgi:hypothetical protein